ncbi:MAG: DinB family protein [Pirellulales bacterium]
MFSMIDDYAAECDALQKAIVGLTDDEMNAVPLPGTWSIRQIVLHLMDAELVMSDRMKRVIAEDRPALEAYDESLFAQRLGYDQADADLAAELFSLNRRQTASILRRLTVADFAREGIHSERGPVSLANLLAGAVGHLEHHLRFLHDKRQMIGKPLVPGTARE